MPEVKRISIRHEAIMDFLIGNPTMKLQDVATAFGVTGPWLSTVIHSDAFQSMLRQKQDVAFHETVLPLREKMMAVAHAALDRLPHMVEREIELGVVSNVAGSMLDRLGYGTKQVGPQAEVPQEQVLITAEAQLRNAQALLGTTLKVEINLNGSNANATASSSAPITIEADGYPRSQRAHGESEARSAIRAEDSGGVA